ncbi:MAG: family 2 glycosyl transferase [Paracoccaceae bacterium]
MENLNAVADPLATVGEALRLGVVICSVGRPDCVRALIPSLAGQTRPADKVLFVVTCPEDLDFDPAPMFPPATSVEVLIAPKGLPSQRNFGLDALAGHVDTVVFFDDDFVPSRTALAGIEAAFGQMPDVSGLTGRVIADGINGAGFTMPEATAKVADWDAAHAGPVVAPRVLGADLVGLYGCNMAFRMSAVGDTRFDDSLPLYAWLEDIDFAARVPGRMVKTDAFSGVHCGVKFGRESAGRRLGYSQVVNPWYLWRKGSVPAALAAKLVFRNVAANHAKSFFPEPWVDRLARASGNRLAVLEILKGSATPGRIINL